MEAAAPYTKDDFSRWEQERAMGVPLSATSQELAWAAQVAREERRYLLVAAEPAGRAVRLTYFRPNGQLRHVTVSDQGLSLCLKRLTERGPAGSEQEDADRVIRQDELEYQLSIVQQVAQREAAK